MRATPALALVKALCMVYLATLKTPPYYGRTRRMHSWSYAAERTKAGTGVIPLPRRWGFWRWKL